MTARRRFTRIVLLVTFFLVASTLARPGRLWFEQRAEIAEAQAQLRETRRENVEMRREVENLAATSSIEQQARKLFGYAHPYDEVYTLSSPLPPRVELPDVWPFSEVGDALERAAESPGS